MSTKKPTSAKKSSLFVRCKKRGGFPPDLLGRINAAAEFLQMDRDEFLAELLRQDMEQLEPMQKSIQDWWKGRTKSRS